MPPSLAHEIRIGGTFVDGTCIRFVNSAKNLGVILDDELSFRKQVIKVVKSCFFTIRNLSRIKPFLTVYQLQIGICAGVFSILDYCNALYFGITERLLDKLQSVQNAAVNLLRRKCGSTERTYQNVSTRGSIIGSESENGLFSKFAYSCTKQYISEHPRCGYKISYNTMYQRGR